MIEKIKEFFRNLFGTNNQNYLDAPKNDIPQNEILQTNNIQSQNKFNEFQNQIRIVPDQEQEKAIRLQKDYKAGLIEEEDLSDEDFNLLSNLYEKQISNTKQSLENYRRKILNIQNKLASNN